MVGVCIPFLIRQVIIDEHTFIKLYIYIINSYLLLAHHLYVTKLSFPHFLVEKIFFDKEKYCKEIKANKKSLIHTKYHISKKTYHEFKEK